MQQPFWPFIYFQSEEDDKQDGWSVLQSNKMDNDVAYS